MSELIVLENATCRSEKYEKGLLHLISIINGSVKTMVELGSYQGESTAIFASNMSNLEILYAVDPWVNGYAPGDICSDGYPMSIVESNFDHRVKKYPTVKKVKTMSQDFVVKIPDASLDFVYVDANHSYESCLADIKAWLPKVKQGGYIGGHDYLSACFIGVVNAVNEVFGKPDLLFDDTSWLKKL